LVTLTTKRFRIYSLAITPGRRDSFQELSLTGISELNDTQCGLGQTIILGSSAVSGSVTSIPVTAVGAAS
jgi:hypothetical protein